MPRVDLHIHSSASDGRFSPAEIVARAAGEGLPIIALTDHDTVDGIPQALEALRQYSGLRVIPGVEISTDVPDGEVHVLGYFVDHDHAHLQASLEVMRDSRWQRAREMVSRLSDMGCTVTWDRVREIAGSGAVGRPHIARAMVEKGHVGSFKEAFSRYIGRDGPAYVERDKMTPAQAVALILTAGGLPVVAHPFTIPDPEAIIAGLKPAGLVGLEVYYSGYTADETKHLVGIAGRYNLVTTGGTDYHGLESGADTRIGGVDIPIEALERFLALAEQRGLGLTSH